ncbi:hypothetical protein I3843_07G182600 [Carya illinoinensis]|nr:hypothetical protein I3843_07G182600 [Carya illinoinensis]
MSKRIIQKRKPTKRSKKKLLKKVVDYLRSDSYMFAPLISSQSRTLRSSAERAEVREPIRENNNKRSIEKIGEYLKSDTYMYAPLVDPPRSISPLPTGSSWYMKRVTTAVSTQNITFQDNEPTDWSSEIHKSIKRTVSAIVNLMHMHLVAVVETDFSNNRKGKLNSQLRKFVVE